MRNRKLFIISLIAMIGIILYAAGCSSGTGGLGDVPSMPTQDDNISGNWSGTWGSYSTTDVRGVIDKISFSESSSSEPTKGTLSGSIQISGFDGATEGTISGEKLGTTVNFTATFSSDLYVECSGSQMGGSISGTYYRYDNGSQTDFGSFLINKD